MVHAKTDNEIQIMKEGGHILAEVISETLKHAKPGISEKELDKFAEKLILKKGAKPGFKKVKSYDYTICACTNDIVVHGLPTSYKLKEGDLFGVDCGVYYKGFYTDSAWTLRVQNPASRGEQKSKIPLRSPSRLGRSEADSEASKNQKDDKMDIFLETGKRALEEAIKQAKVGNRIGHISKAIQSIVEGAGYSVVKSLVGHGIGRELHEQPEVPGFLTKDIAKTPLLKEGMILAIEVIYNMGKSDVVGIKQNPWTIKTKDNSMSATFEKTVAVTKQGPFVLT